MDPLGDEQLGNVGGMDGEPQLSANGLSDVLDVIGNDPDLAVTNSNTMSVAGRHRLSSETAHIVILEQPASKAMRFRYECEGRSAGSIPGVNSTPENKTFPTIQVVGYKGRAAVIVSCVTKDPPYRAHPHNLVGKEGCKKGVFSQQVHSNNNMIVSFSNLGIQCVKKRDIEEALRVREEIRVDPFGKGFAHRSQPTGIDLNAVRLCFQVFLEGPEPNTYTRALAPVVSDPIYDKKAMSDLVICKLSHASAPAIGGTEMILLCEKVAKEDIQVRFFEERDNEVKWEAYANFQPSQVHKQVAITFETPRYERIEFSEPVTVYIQLKRPSDGATSEPHIFEMIPVTGKRQRIDNSNKRHWGDDDSPLRNDRPHAALNELRIKQEPADRSPQMFYPSNLSPLYMGQGQSPQPTPINSPQMQVRRTPSPAEFKPNSPYMFTGHAYGAPSSQPTGLVGHPSSQPSPGPGPSPSITLQRNVLLAGGTCIPGASFSPDPLHGGPSGMQPGVGGGLQQGFPGMVDTVNMGHAMGGMPQPDYMHGNPSPLAYEQQGQTYTTLTNAMNGGGIQPYQNEPFSQHFPQGTVSFEQEVNSSDLVRPISNWDGNIGNLSDNISNINLTMSETGPS
ncbi:embryonic polarity protein dorsal-like isoform X4 [Thrips palmi]|uniref:Embryonic polarity protein dorsal-like isoform X4 n=1 Tax=Thrips palmi TaxID=161013 RepID=A0A6P8ZQ95_THRPL|nr:embryonic polarity protein dorsal-like isoform X4 [Thrips palmi]